jgi:YidC/Oxa1 family membrane protein insertase
MKYDRNTIIGSVLIALLLFLYIQLNTPSAAELEREKFVQDSIALAKKQAVSIPAQAPAVVAAPVPNVQDSVSMAALSGKFGSLAQAAVGTEQFIVLENALATYTLSNRGGRLVKVTLKNYDKITEDSLHKENKQPVALMEHPANRFEYLLPVGLSSPVSTQELYFETKEISKQEVVFTLTDAQGQSLTQAYKLADKDYTLDYQVNARGFGAANGLLTLNWVNHLDRIELNTNYEKNYSSIYFRKSKGKSDHCSCTGDDKEELPDQPVDWVSHAHQFFNTSLIATGKPIASATLSTKMGQPTDRYLKVVESRLAIPVGSEAFKAKIYSGPNEFKRLRAMQVSLEDVIPYGSSILGTINRWVIRPIFLFLSAFIGNAGIVIFLLTLLVKIATYPLSYKMILSQAKMAALKPRIEKVKEKAGDDPQKVQVETMKLYGEYGVNPLGGCLPMLVQMPIWLALYRFFPAAIEFRQVSFLWINDLTNYESWLRLPFDIPFLGSTIGIFALLWTITTLAYSYYSTKDMDFSSNPAMKYMQYITPVIFFPFFNTAAAGLSFYMAMSNMINIGQTIVTRRFVIDNDKVLAKLEKNKAEPKKKGKFRQRFDDLMAEQQRQAELMRQQQQKKK